MCRDWNARRVGSCAVGVVSSPTDSPPRACWLKAHVGSAVKKPGVKACWPGSSLQTSASRSKSEETPAASAMAAATAPPTIGNTFPVGKAADVGTLRQRAEAIRNAMRHAWGSYKKFAWGSDEIGPISGRRIEKNFGHAVTMVDALDTLWIMGMKQEFEEAKHWLREHLPGRITRMSRAASVFETTIRSLGGLLSAYDLSKDKVFLDLSKQMGQKILEVVSPDGIVPYTFGGGNGGMGCRSLAESGTIQLEMAYLSHVTGDPTYSHRVDRFYNTVRKAPSIDGLYANCWQAGRGKITFGADGDSFYEYLLKVWLFKGGDRVDLPGREATEAAEAPPHPEIDFLWTMFDDAANGLEKHLVRKGKDSLTYVGNLKWNGQSGTDNVGHYEEEMEHLVCFVAGWLALGAHTSWGKASRDRRMQLATEIAQTCWQMYKQQPTGIAPERVKRMQMDLKATDTREYILRPEALEAWFYMQQLSGDPLYREWGWRAFQAFEEWLRVPYGYASLRDVRSTSKNRMDRMESFFLAETLKYLFLLEDPDHNITLDKYVFNTEGHPFSRTRR